jgi:pimeloyl-ACP methyl ester carboxylesterase
MAEPGAATQEAINMARKKQGDEPKQTKKPPRRKGAAAAGKKDSAFRVEPAAFFSQGDRLAADLYLPANKEKPPVVVMAHGFAARRHFGLPPFAERFAAAGLAVLLFDYRGFGDSQGEPRNYVNPRRHLQDWQAAVEHARGLPTVDGGRLALWGVSFGGGHVLVTAARLPGISAVVAQVPFVDGISSTTLFPPLLFPLAVPRVVADLAAELGGRPRVLVPVVGPSGLRCLTGPDCEEGILRTVPEGMEFENRVPARILLDIMFYRPTSEVSRVKAPVLMIGARGDTLIPYSAVERAARKIPDCVLETIEGGHFDPYFDECFEHVSTLERDFLVQKLAVA